MSKSKVLRAVVIGGCLLAMTGCGIGGAGGVRNDDQAQETVTQTIAEGQPVLDVSYEEDTPEYAAQKVIQALAVQDWDTVDQYSDNSDQEERSVVYIGVGDGNDPEEAAFFTAAFQDLSAQVVESHVDGDKAELTLDITNRDMTDVMKNFVKTVITRSLVTMGEEDMDDDKALRLLTEEMDSRKGTEITSRVTVSFSWKEERWILHFSTAFTNAVLGNMFHFLPEETGLAENWEEDLQEDIQRRVYENTEKLVDQAADWSESSPEDFIDGILEGIFG